MRIAFVADMHGNLPAFEAVVAEIERLGPFDRVVSGGDVVVGGLYPGECVQLLIDLSWEGVRGNADEMVVDAATDGSLPKDGWPAGLAENEALQAMARWTAEQMDDAQIEYLAGLPLRLDVTGPSGSTLALVHATPWGVFPIVWQDAGDSEKLELLDRAGTDALIYGHIHYAYQQQFGGRLLCCAGAVGLPYDGDTRPCFAVATDDGDGWRFEHVRVDYDHEAYARELDASDMPGAETDARAIRTATLDRG